jgi:hypothetical protein
LLIGICDRFKCLPSQALAEDAGIIRLLKIEALGRKEESA